VSPAHCARAFALALGLLGCGAATPPSPRPTSPVVEDSAPRAALEYVPAAGLRWLCLARPQLILADPTLGPLVPQVLDEQRLEAFAELTAVDLRRLPTGVVAGYDLGTLYVAELGAAGGAEARARFQDRLGETARVKHPRPFIYRVTGTRNGTPRALVSVSDRLLAVATGDPTLARIAEAYAERRLKSPTALRGAALSTLPNAPSDALAVVYFPGPFVGDWAHAAHGVLASAFAVSVAVEPASPPSVLVTATVTGDFADRQLRDEVEAFWGELAHSPTGLLFGLERAEKSSIVADLHQLTWSALLDGPALAAGLRAATTANVSEMFGEGAQTPTGQSP